MVDGPLDRPRHARHDPIHWTLARDEARFNDQKNNVNIERILQWLPDGFTSATVSSLDTPLQTRWEYHFLNTNAVQVKNLSNGRSFSLNRCPEAAPASNEAPAAAAAAPSGRLGPSFDCSLAKDALS